MIFMDFNIETLKYIKNCYVQINILKVIKWKQSNDQVIN